MAESYEGLLQKPVEAFDEAVGLRVVGCRRNELDSPNFSELLKNWRQKLCASIRRSCWNAEMLYPAGSKSVNDRLGRLIHYRHGDGPPSKLVYGRQQIPESVGEGESDQIHIDMIEPLIQGLKITNWRHHMLNHL